MILRENRIKTSGISEGMDIFAVIGCVNEIMQDDDSTIAQMIATS